MSIRVRYRRHLYKNLSYLGSWPPLDQMTVGTFGVFEDGAFKPEGVLDELLGSAVESQVQVLDASRLVAQHEVEYSAAASAGVSVTSVASARIRATFKSTESFLFAVEEMEVSRIDLGQLKSILVSNDVIGRWPKDRAVITHSVQAQRATVILNDSARSTIDLVAETALPGVELARLQVGAGGSVAAGSVKEFTQASASTPLFRASYLVRPLLRKSRLKDFRGFDAGEPRRATIDVEPVDVRPEDIDG